MAIGNLAYADERTVNRDEVHHRVRATAGDGRSVPLLIVNISPHGMMARCETDLAAGTALRFALPLVGTVTGDVRWALGGRIGAQFPRAIPLAAYYNLLAVLLKSG